MEVINTIRDSTISWRYSISPKADMPISRMNKFVSASLSRIVKGSPISLLRKEGSGTHLEVGVH